MTDLDDIVLHLVDADTDEVIGIATRDQVTASLEPFAGGFILVDTTTGRVVHNVRRVYVR